MKTASNSKQSHFKQSKSFFSFILLGSFFCFFIMTGIGCSSTPEKLGVHSGKLHPCPESPNCVSSQMPSEDTHYIEPLSYNSSLESANSKLLKILQELDSEIITHQPNYIHAEFTSFLFRFVDDVEFLFDEKDKKIHVRSASRVGRSDLGVNRSRVEEIRSLFDSN